MRFDDRKGLICRCTYGIIFLGTPHRGSSKADFADIVGKIARASLHQPNTTLIDELKKNSPTLMTVSKAFARMLDEKEFAFEIVSYLEELPTAIGMVII